MKTQHTYPVEEIIRKFSIEGEEFVCQPYGSGHINDTFLVRSLSSSPDYLLQRINHQVFQNVEALMENMWLVTRHIREKLSSVKDRSRFDTIELVTTKDGRRFYQDPEGLFWRVMTFVPRSVSFDVVQSEEQAFQAGKGFGKFQALLSDLPGEKLHETIPDFHNMENRYEKFFQALDIDAKGRKSAVGKEISFVLDRQQEMEAMYRHVKNGNFPLRITHNDTKFNNVLLDQDTHEAVCVIDLDTVMPGVVPYDFGDAVRTITNTSAEDEKQLEKIKLNLEYYEAFARGYLEETGSFLTEIEMDYLAFSGRYMTFIMGLRFLTDYLAGDVYYKIQCKEHNLQRARAQFELVSCMEKHYAAMTEVITRLIRRSPAG